MSHDSVRPPKESKAFRMSRRKFLAATPALVVVRKLLAQEAFQPAIATRRMNNVMISVSDMQRSVAFYEKLFGPATPQGDVAIFRFGQKPAFFGITQAKIGAKPDFLSFGLTVDNFFPNQLVRVLSDLGAKSPQVINRDGTPELFAGDPDNIRFQLQDVAYGHGSGPKGDVLPPEPKPAGKVPLPLRSISHVTLTITNGERTQKFYEDAFSLPVQAKQGPSVTSFAVGKGPDCIVFGTTANNTNANAGINHACFTIDNFDPNRVMGILEDNGMEAIEFGNAALIKPMTCRLRLRQHANNGGGPTSPMGTPELYFNDPDNISIQIQDVKYCGGSGALGQICP
jgi:catechol 2,3-dioxygenase-like lactoylglutathione lyase family enzyme